MRKDREARLVNRDHSLMLREMGYETSKREDALRAKRMADTREKWRLPEMANTAEAFTLVTRPEPSDGFLGDLDLDLDLEDSSWWSAPLLLALGMAGFLLHAYTTSETPSETAESSARA